MERLPDLLEFQLLELNKDWNKMSKEEKQKQVEWCIVRCRLNMEGSPEERDYYIKQIDMLVKLKKEVI